MGTPIEIKVKRPDFTQIDAASRRVFGVPMNPADLTHEQALQVIASFLHAFAEGTQKVVTRDPRTMEAEAAITSDLDGDAPRHAVERAARMVAPRIDDDRPLYVTITPTRWQRLAGHRPVMLCWYPSEQKVAW